MNQQFLRSIPVLAWVAFTCSQAQAQSFNIDFGPPGFPLGAPSASYGGAMLQGGFWNEVEEGESGRLLAGLDGSPTPVTITQFVGTGFDVLSFNPATIGDVELLMDDHIEPEGLMIFLVDNLTPGVYDVISYAWRPADPLTFTRVSLLGSPDPVQIVGGAWPGDHVLGVTYARHQITVESAGDSFAISFELALGFEAAINGMQIRPVSEDLGWEFNVDIATDFGVPSSGYGGAPGQTGFWNPVVPILGQRLRDLEGRQTLVTAAGLGPGPTFGADNAGTTGGNEDLLDDGQNVGAAGTSATWLLQRIRAGSYDVTSYAWAPDDASFRTDVNVPGSTDPIQSIGGAWPGNPVLGITHAKHKVTVPEGRDLEIRFMTAEGFGTANGFQVERRPPIGDNYCLSSDNSTGEEALIAASGSRSVAANDLLLSSTDLPPNVPGIYYFGANQVLSGFGQGFRCVGGQVFRYPPVFATNDGVLSFAPDLTVPNSLGNIVPGSTWNFQCWYRDSPGGMSTFNLTDGIEISFLP